MRKHQYVKVDCNCERRATYFKCKYCDTIVYHSLREVRALKRQDAECHSPKAPQASAQEKFKGMMGGVFDCLSPDYETYMKDRKQDTCVNC